MQSPSELRRDIVSGDWVVIATGRAKRPDDFLKIKNTKLKQPKTGCPFEAPDSEALATYPLCATGDNPDKNAENWRVKVVPNKYPAFSRGICPVFHKNGPYDWTEGVGIHEIVITRDHDKDMSFLDKTEIELTLQAFLDRYNVMKEDPCVEYVSIFQNHGSAAGASIAHPHSQIIGIPVIPPDVGRSLKGSENYFHEHKSCVHCLIVGHELKAEERIIYENKHFAVIAPFASKTSFESRIFPKKHNPYFETLDGEERSSLSDALKTILSALRSGLDDPDYNFFIHTSPVKRNQEYEHYHWHLEIIPKLAVWAGFEIGTGIEISTIAPETAAKFLREVKI